MPDHDVMSQAVHRVLCAINVGDLTFAHNYNYSQSLTITPMSIKLIISYKHDLCELHN